ncbi:MAG: AAA family ATPase [Candidatus Margulisiibacteriota bacterium]|jgi:adenylate kinase
MHKKVLLFTDEYLANRDSFQLFIDPERTIRDITSLRPANGRADAPVFFGIAGVPGVGKTTISRMAAGLFKQLEVIDFATEMLKVFASEGIARDQIKYTSWEKQLACIRQTALNIIEHAQADLSKVYLLDIHNVVIKPEGFQLGVPSAVVPELNFTGMIILKADADTVKERALADKTRVRKESVEDLQKHQRLSSIIARATSIFTGTKVLEIDVPPADVIENGVKVFKPELHLGTVSRIDRFIKDILVKGLKHDRLGIETIFSGIEAGVKQGQSLYPFLLENKELITKAFPEYRFFDDYTRWHALEIAKALDRLINKDYEWFYAKLDIVDCQREEFFKNLETLRSLYCRMPERLQALLWKEIVVHDLGKTAGGTVDHPKAGAEIMVRIASETGTDLETAAILAELTKVHPDLGNVIIGDITPDSIFKILSRVENLGVSQEEFLQLWTLLGTMDLSGHQGYSMRNEFLERFLRMSSLAGLTELKQDHFAERMLSLSREMGEKWAKLADPQRAQALEKLLSDVIPAKNMDEFRDILINKVDGHYYFSTICWNLSLENTAKLLNFIVLVVKTQGLDKLQVRGAFSNKENKPWKEIFQGFNTPLNAWPFFKLEDVAVKFKAGEEIVMNGIKMKLSGNELVINLDQ